MYRLKIANVIPVKIRRLRLRDKQESIKLLLNGSPLEFVPMKIGMGMTID